MKPQDKKRKLAGTYLYFDKNKELCTGRGILVMDKGTITDILPYEPGQKDTIYLNNDKVIFPGLLDLHKHVEACMYPPFDDALLLPHHWDNRLEWRLDPAYKKEFLDPNRALMDHWFESVTGDESGLTHGTMAILYSELLALSGGTTLQQEEEGFDKYSYLDCHRKVSLTRSSAAPEDLEAKASTNDLPIESFLRIYMPRKRMFADDPESYLPQDTSTWGINPLRIYGTDTTYISKILDNIKNPEMRTSRGYLIHLSEGRSETDAHTPDPYTELEFKTFMSDIKNELEEGTITKGNVRDAHINLIHGCGINLQDEEVLTFLKECGIGLIWSPVSNLMLYRDTPKLYTLLGDKDINISIGADWPPSGSKTVREECQFAAKYIMEKEPSTDEMSMMQNILKSVTLTSSSMIGSKTLGNIAVNCAADLFILSLPDADGDKNKEISLNEALYSFFKGDGSDIDAVYVAGRPLYGDHEIISKECSEFTKVPKKINPSAKDKYLCTEGLCTPEVFKKSFENAFPDYSPSTVATTLISEVSTSPSYPVT